jgi:putative oxidoreductase
MGSLMMYHGIEKVAGFNEPKFSNLDFWGMGTTPSQLLVIAVEFTGGLLVTIGLLTRMAALAVVAWLFFVLAKSFRFDVIDSGEKTMLFLIGFATIIVAGPGHYSFDKIVENKISSQKKQYK